MRKNVTMNALKEGITSNAARNGDTASLVNLATTSSMEKQRLSHVSIGYVTMRKPADGTDYSAGDSHRDFPVTGSGRCL